MPTPCPVPPQPLCLPSARREGQRLGDDTAATSRQCLMPQHQTGSDPSFFCPIQAPHLLLHGIKETYKDLPWLARDSRPTQATQASTLPPTRSHVGSHPQPHRNSFTDPRQHVETRTVIWLSTHMTHVPTHTRRCRVQLYSQGQVQTPKTYRHP